LDDQGGGSDLLAVWIAEGRRRSAGPDRLVAVVRALRWFLIVMAFLAAPLVRSRSVADLLIAGSIAAALLQVVVAVFQRGPRRLLSDPKGGERP
jgi:hypothetical protein